MGTASCVSMKAAPISASAADAITLFIILVMEWMAPFGVGLGRLSLRKRCTHDQIKDFLTDMYYALLLNRKIMSLALYLMVAYGCVSE